MVEGYWRQSALTHLNLAARAARTAKGDAAEAGVTLGERPPRALIDLRGPGGLGEAGFLTAVEAALGFLLPLNSPETAAEGAVAALWLGPDEWLVIGPDRDGAGAAALADRLRAALDGQFAAVTDVSETYSVIAVAGPSARDVLAKGCPLDLHPGRFGPGHVAQTLLGRADVILHRIGAETYELYCRRSFAEYLWAWLEDAGLEYGVAVAAG